MEIENTILVALINYIKSHGALVAALIVYWFLLGTVVTYILINFLIILIILAFDSKKLLVFTIWVPVKLSHLLHSEDGVSFEGWQTIPLSFTWTNVTMTAYLSILIVIYLIYKGLKNRRTEKKREMRLYIWMGLYIILLLFLSTILDNGVMLELATRLKFYQLANWIKGEPILCHLFLWPINACISTILVAFYEGSQWFKNWLITEKGVTTYQLGHLTLFFAIPAFFFPVVLGRPCPLLEKLFNYQFTSREAIPLLIEKVCCDPKVFVVVAVMGFLSVISLIFGRRMTEK